MYVGETSLDHFFLKQNRQYAYNRDNEFRKM